MDTLATMRTFIGVAEAGSFVGAAERLGLAKSIVSKQVAALEERLHARLVNRTTRSFSLTEAGAAYLERARDLVAEIDALESSLGDHALHPRGVLRINAPVSFGISHLGAALADYTERFPDVRIDLALNDRIVDLVEEGFDVAIRIARRLESSLVARRLATTRGVLCAAPAYLARHGTPRRPEDLRAHRCLGYTYSLDGDAWHLEGPRGAVRVRPDFRMRANNGDALVAAAIAGAGLLLEPGFIVEPAIRAGRLVPLLLRWRLPEYGIHAVYPHRRHLSAKVRSLVDFLAARYATGL